jgi:hypothetical protein
MMTEKHVEALTVAMAIAPGVYARNRMFDLFTLPGVQRAKTRAAIVRGIVPHLPRGTTITLTREGDRGGEPVWVLRYAIAELRLTRVVELSPSELSALRVLASRASVHVLPVEANDRTVVDSALARLIELSASAAGAAGSPGGSTRAPSPSWPPPPPRFPA